VEWEKNTFVKRLRYTYRSEIATSLSNESRLPSSRFLSVRLCPPGVRSDEKNNKELNLASEGICLGVHYDESRGSGRRGTTGEGLGKGNVGLHCRSLTSC
jgi:hypothetical protein